MTFTYADPVGSRRDALRLLVGDTSPGQVLLQDEEYDYLLTVWGDYPNYTVAAQCAETIAAKLAREIDISADSQSLGANVLQEKYLRLAERLRSQASGEYPGEIYIGGIDPITTELTGTAPAFGTQMHDHPEAGQQDYGDVHDTPDWRERWVGG